MNRRPPTAGPLARRAATLGGVFAIAVATLMYEILLTRIFSVTMWYHFAFMAISLAMFGLAAGAILVELLKRRETNIALARTALAFALTSAISSAETSFHSRALPPIAASSSEVYAFITSRSAVVFGV